MKKIALVIIALVAMCSSTKAQSLGDILGKIGGDNPVSSITDIVSDVIGGDVTVADLVGSWKYTSPAVTFRSDNLLKKAGGAAAAAKVENELEPYYKKCGLEGLTLTVEPDSTFTMKVKRVSLKGNIVKGEDGQYAFDFKAFGKVKIGSMPAYMAKSGSNVKLTFDVSNLITLIEKISAISGNSSLKAMSSLLSSYDGLNAGFKLSPTK